MWLIGTDEQKFLYVLYLCSGGNSSVYVSELMIQERVSFSYKKLHALAAYWQVQGCVVSHTKRGGVSEYQLTNEGSIAALRLKRLFRFRFLLFVIIFILVILFSSLFLFG